MVRLLKPGFFSLFRVVLRSSNPLRNNGKVRCDKLYDISKRIESFFEQNMYCDYIPLASILALLQCNGVLSIDQYSALHDTVQYITVQYKRQHSALHETVQYSIRDSAVQYTRQCTTVQYSTTDSAVQYTRQYTPLH